MQNNFFSIKLDRENAGISSLSLVGDDANMNFCREGKALFALRNFNLEKIEENECSAVAVSFFMGVRATTKYKFEEDHLTVSIVLLNENPYPVYFKDGDVVLETPINDAYDSGTVCMKERCHAHIWTGLEYSHILCERMGESDYNLGIIFQNGSFLSYRQEECKHCSRGYLSLNVSAFHLLRGDSYEIKCTVFKHSGKNDFFESAKRIDGYARVESERGYTFTAREKIDFSVETNREIKKASCTVNGEYALCRTEKEKVYISFIPKNTGEYKAIFEIDGRRGVAVFNIISDIEKLIHERLNFIVDHQQCSEELSPLYGAYLIYDNEEQRQYFDYGWADHNANRERMGMSLAIVKWLQRHDNEKMRKSIDVFTQFLLRECVDEEDGTCYGNIGKDKSKVRLYNAPWVMLYFTELYKLTNDKKYLDNKYKLMSFLQADK